MIAIDFGTTNSSVAVFSEGDTEPRLQRLEFGDPESYDPNVLPSAICLCKSYECGGAPETYGHEALRHGFELPHDSNLLQEMKLYFDRSTLEPPTLVETKVVTALREEGGVLNPVVGIQRHKRYEGDVPIKPQQFVPARATLINEVIRRSTMTARDRGQIAIGVPASFHELGMRRLREAAKRGAFGESAGYEGVFLYPEPLAAARSYMQVEKGNVLVLDYGGGTLDITVMSLDRPGDLETAKIVFSGFPEGGCRMDEEILNHCLATGDSRALAWFRAQPLRTKLRIKRNVEKAKIALSVKEEAFIDVSGSGLDPIPLTPQDLSYALQPIMTRMVAKVTQTVVKAVEAIENIDYVVLSGGTSLNKVVQRSVLAMFRHITENRFVLPDPADRQKLETCLCAVAKGLAWLHRDGFAPIRLERSEDI